MEFQTDKEFPFKYIDRFLKRKPCDICGSELGDGFKIRKKPFRISIERYCQDCKDCV